MAHRILHRLRVASAVLLLALVFGVLDALLARIQYPRMPWPRFWAFTLPQTLPSWVLFAALSPFVYALSTRARIDRASWPVAFPIHAVAGIVIITAHMAGVSLWVGRFVAPDRPFWQTFSYFVANFGMLEYFLYWCAVSIIHASHYQAEVRKREVAAARLEAGLTQARLAALRAQINPHFLFNALNAINGLALGDDRDKLTGAVNALSDLLRVTLDDSQGQEVPLAAEMRMLDRYLEIQQVRFGDRLQVERRIEPGLEDALVPSFLLQPLVENSIVHGASRQTGPARIALSAWRREGAVHLEVTDNGPGFGAPRSPSGGSGIGLSNTRARLEHLYAAAHRFETGAAPGGGGRVTIEIPFRLTAAAPEVG